MRQGVWTTALLALVLVAEPAAQRRFRFVRATSTLDTSAYRQNTYGAPDHYCDPTRSLASSGTGTLGDAWNLNQCQSEPVCGDVIGILPVGSGTPVQVSVPATYQEPAFLPTADCTLGNPLVYVTQTAAITLDRSTIATNQNRSELRTNGTAESADVTGTGRAAYGCYSNDYIIYDGWFVDMAQAGINGDQGIITARNATGCEFRNFAIKGTTTDMDSNPIAWRPDNTVNTVLSNFAIWDFVNTPTGGGLNQEGYFADQYGDQTCTMGGCCTERCWNTVGGRVEHTQSERSGRAPPVAEVCLPPMPPRRPAPPPPPPPPRRRRCMRGRRVG